MAQEHMKTYVVDGTSQKVRRSRCVWQTSDFAVLEMSAAFAASVASPGIATPAGIAQEWSRNPPGTPFDTSLEAGLSGDEIMVYTNGAIARAELGGTVAAGQPLIAGTDARVITGGAVGLGANSVVTGAWLMGTALEGGTVGQVVRMEVRIGLLL